MMKKLLQLSLISLMISFGQYALADENIDSVRETVARMIPMVANADITPLDVPGVYELNINT